MVREKSASALFFRKVFQQWIAVKLTVVLEYVIRDVGVFLDDWVFIRAFLVIFILVALAMIVATILGFSAQVEEFLENVVPTRYQIMANSDAYIRILSMGLLILAVPVGFYVVIRLLGVRESRREKFEREKRAAENLNQYQQAFRERMKKC